MRNIYIINNFYFYFLVIKSYVKYEKTKNIKIFFFFVNKYT